MLDPVIIIPQAQESLASDVNDWIQGDLYGIKKCKIDYTKLLASAVIQIALNTNLPQPKQQCLLSALKTL